MDNQKEENLRAFREAWKNEFGEELSEERARAELDRVTLFYRMLGERIAELRKRRDEEAS